MKNFTATPHPGDKLFQQSRNNHTQPEKTGSRVLIQAIQQNDHLHIQWVGSFAASLPSPSSYRPNRNDPENPWLTLFVPLAMADDLIMSTLLALGGASLCTYSRHALKQACTFYAVILRSMKHRMTELVQGNFSHLVNTLVTAIALSIFETMIGDSRGVLLYHLQACRELLQLSHRKSITIDPAVLAFILELYLYTSAVGTTFVFDDRPAKLTFDAGYDWLQSLRCGSRGYGFMVGHAGKLIQLLPRLGQTVGRWISQDCDLESSNTDEAFLSFQTELRSWVPSYDQDTKIPNLSDTISDSPTSFALYGSTW
ncbi:hypothetical protein EYB25_002375 [Talaromyces marneffei]|nr:hypothetical protein EYB25_002375 [Talaromyces marneffei]